MSIRLSIIPAGAVTDRRLEPRDLQVLCLLGRHIDRQGWCARSQVKMAAELDCGRSSVQRSLERLIEAGWVEKKRRGTSVDEATQPSASYAYRVRLDRDDYVWEAATRDGESHAESASQAEGCPQVGTPADDGDDDRGEADTASQGAQPDGHPGAQPYVGTGAQPYVGTKNDPLERPPLERERDARARERKDHTARFIVDFEARWPSAPFDDRQRVAYAAAALSDDEQKAALEGIGPFLDGLKRLGRKGVPAGSTYLTEKRWTLLEAKPEQGTPKTYPLDSTEAKAIGVLYDVAGKGSFFHGVMKRAGAISYRKAVTPRLLALAEAGPKDGWIVLDHQQAGAWDALLREAVAVARRPLKSGDRAPWPWPPSVDGKLYTTGPPATLMSADDEAFLSEQARG